MLKTKKRNKTKTRVRVEDEIEELRKELQKYEKQQQQERQKECRSFTSSQIKKVWDDSKDMEMLQARVEQVAAEESTHEKVMEQIDQKIETILEKFSLEQFQTRVEIIVPKVLNCHYENIEMEMRVNAYGCGSSNIYEIPSVEEEDGILIEFVDLSILLFILRRKRKHLKKEAEESAKAFSKPIESRSQSSEEQETKTAFQDGLKSHQRSQTENDLNEAPRRSTRSLNSAESTRSDGCTHCNQQQTDDITIHIQNHQAHHQKNDESQCEPKTLIRFLFISGTVGLLLTVGFVTYIWLS